MFINYKKTIGFLSMYTLLLFSSGFYFMNANGMLALLMMGISAVFLCYCYGRKTKIVSHLSFSMIILILICVLSCMVAGDSIKDVLIYIIGLIIAMYISAKIMVLDYIRIYVKVMRCLMIGSLLFYIYGWISQQNYWILPFPNLFSPLGGESAMYTFFATLHDYGKQVRNASIFWEPGAYQTFLVITFIFETVIHSEKCNMYRYITIISLLSTMSTMGIIVAFFCYIYLLLGDKDNVGKSVWFRIVLIIIITFIIGLVFWELYGDLISFLLDRNLISKLDDFINYNVDNQSSLVRADSLIYPFQMFIQSPLLGVGNSGYEWMVGITGHTMAVCTPLNWFAKYGALYGVLMFVGLYKVIKDFFSGRVERFFFFSLLLLSIATENYDNNPCIILLCLFGLKANKKAF